MVAPNPESLVRSKRLRTRYYLSILLNGFGLALWYALPGWSHGAIATVTRTFSVEAHYSSGEPMAQAQVAVYSPDNVSEPWLLGQTNAAGEFTFTPDTSGNWEVVIRQAGHGATVNVPVDTQVAPQPESRTAAIASSSSPRPLQRWASAGAALWGLTGTVLFFSRGKQS